MIHKPTVGEHLRNSDLYYAPALMDPDPEWKLQLFRQYAVRSQLNLLIQEKTGVLKWLVFAGIPFLCVALVFAAYFGFIHPGEWIKKFAPAVGMKEALIVIAIVNTWILVAKRRIFADL